MIVYDCIFVFKTDVMVTVATKIENPMKFIIPDQIVFDVFSAINKDTSYNYSMLGYGDIFIPALLLQMALRIDFIEAFKTVKAELTSTTDTALPKSQPVLVTLMELRERVEVKFKSSTGRMLYKGTMLGYILGLCFTVIFLHVTRKPVPALLFILPTQIATLFATAFYQNGWERAYAILMFDEDKTLQEQQKQPVKGRPSAQDARVNKINV